MRSRLRRFLSRPESREHLLYPMVVAVVVALIGIPLARGCSGGKDTIVALAPTATVARSEVDTFEMSSAYTPSGVAYFSAPPQTAPKKLRQRLPRVKIGRLPLPLLDIRTVNRGDVDALLTELRLEVVAFRPLLPENCAPPSTQGKTPSQSSHSLSDLRRPVTVGVRP